MNNRKIHHVKFAYFIRYIMVGFYITVVNIIVYQTFILFIDYRISNLIAIIISKVIAYLANKQFVFKSRCKSIRELVFEFGRFIVARSVTGLIDYFGLIALVEIFHADRIISKCIIQIIVILMNYYFGKKMVFCETSSDVVE